MTTAESRPAPARSPTLRPRLSLAVLVRVEAVVLLVAAVLFSLGPHPLDPTTIGTDASNYYAAGLRLDAGHPLYAISPGDRPVPLNPPLWNAPLVSPPFIAVLWRPLALLGDSSMLLWWAGALVCLIACTLFVISRGTPIRNIILTLLFPAIGIAAVSGNVNSYLVAICLGVALAASRGRSGTAGALVALATAIKLTPVLLICWFIFRRDWRAVRVFAGTLLVLGVIQLAGSGLDNNLAFFSVMRDTTTTGATPLSIGGLLRTLGAPSVLIGAGPLLAMAGGIALAWWFRQRPQVAFVSLCVAVLFSSPVVNLGNFAILLAAFWPIAGRPAAGEAAAPLPATVMPVEPVAGVVLADP